MEKKCYKEKNDEVRTKIKTQEILKKNKKKKNNDNAWEKEEETKDKLREVGVKFKMSGAVLHQPARWNMPGSGPEYI